MMYDEFLKLANVSENAITLDTYQNYIEPMYMAAPSMSKDVFVKMLNIEFIKKNYLSPNNIEQEIVKVVEELRSLAGHAVTNDQENTFIWLAKKFCKMKMYDYAYSEYEVKNYAHFNAKFVVKTGSDYVRYEVRNGKLINSVIC